MNSQNIENSFEEKFLKINSRLRKVIREFNSNDIRLFRVEIKKMRAFLRLLKKENANKELELPKKLHKFYNEVGVIRSLKLLQKQIRSAAIKSKQSTPKSFLKLLSTKIKNSSRYARDMVKNKNPFEKGQLQLEKQISQKLTITQSREFTWKEITTLKNLLGSAFTSDESLHSIRKLFKDLLHTWPYIRKEVRVILPSAIFCSREDLDFITKRLGKFQDTCTKMELLRESNAGKEKDAKEQKFLIALEETWKKEKDVLRNEIHLLFQKRIPARQGFALLADGNHIAIENKLLAR